MGMIWYAFHAQFLIFSYPALAEYVQALSEKKTITITWFSESQKVQEQTEIIWASDANAQVHAVVAAWLTYLQGERLIDQKIKLQTCALTAHDREVLVSFSHSIVSEHTSIIKKWFIIESLIATLKPLCKELTALRLLVHHEPLYDEHIDCSVSLPFETYIQQYQLKNALNNQKSTYTVLLHPCGDKKTTGRVIGREFERSLTRNLADSIKKLLDNRHDIQVMITHDIGTLAEHQQHAELANRLQADIYIDLRCYENSQMIPEVGIYFPLYNPSTDFWLKKTTPLSLVPIDKAYLKNILTSVSFAQQFTQTLKELYGRYVLVQNTYGLPLTPLIGIQAPSCVIECGIQKPEQIAELAQALSHLIDTIF